MKFLDVFKHTDTVSSNSWKRAMEEREIEKNIFHVTGKLEESKEFAAIAMQEVTLPAQTPETIIKPIVVFSRELLTPMDYIKMAM